MTITKELRLQIRDEVKKLNDKLFSDQGDGDYEVRFSGKFLYLDFIENKVREKICRLTHNGNMDDWLFDLYEWSSEKYNTEDDFFMVLMKSMELLRVP
jgi:hypothetical protein